MKPRSRTLVSFGVLIVALTAIFLGWSSLQGGPEDEDAPPGLRRVLELNGRIWKAMFRKDHESTCEPPPKGTKPRVNGDIGLTGPFDPSKWSMFLVPDADDPKSVPQEISLAQIQRLPRSETATLFKCIEGWSEEMGYAGVKFSDFMKAFSLKPKRYVGLETNDGEYYVSIDLESMEHPQTMLVYEMNGMPLSVENGAPLRLIIPVKYGIKSLKRIGKIFFSDKRPRDYWAERGYDWHAGL